MGKLAAALLVVLTSGLSMSPVEAGGTGVTEFVAVLSDPTRDARTRANAARAVGERRGRAARALSDLRTHLTDGDPGVRYQVAAAMVRIDPATPHVRPILTEALRDPDWANRYMGALALGLQGKAARSSLESLLDHTDDRDSLVRAQVLASAAAIAPEDPTVIDALRNAREKDHDEDVRGLAGQLLGALSRRAD